ncbi:CesT family type III secretion system chaperone [Marinomonas mediterranea]|jgi:hypothetical protein|uniref:Type III chaperone ShcO1 n=1 Tax=Marinomonas mediterranea (strain ATCC 700492 / JCM 21426 / NBRC 103028 / MMB-1) TaxID=717774 RepID=F2JYU6_MARM1|nr:CesT family type III secretion system chaperone [Marinomonas mediterranea]ADZ89721.1 type III chaperone ShcO1 [Marinomonas mediterranea MMB-1]WCN15948.1 hypothetical protein GV053_02115 [Marinomonas mediterranea MMB-1]
MTQPTLLLLKSQLQTLALETEHIAQILRDGYLLLEREALPVILITVTENKQQLHLTSALMTLEKDTSPTLFAHALHLNFLPQHTFSANIGFDAENDQLCLRYCHTLTNEQYALNNTLNNFSHLAAKISLSLQQFRGTLRS